MEENSTPPSSLTTQKAPPEKPECAVTLCGQEGKLVPICAATPQPHYMHVECLRGLLTNNEHPQCPMCRDCYLAEMKGMFADNPYVYRPPSPGPSPNPVDFEGGGPIPFTDNIFMDVLLTNGLFQNPMAWQQMVEAAVSSSTALPPRMRPSAPRTTQSALRTTQTGGSIRPMQQASRSNLPPRPPRATQSFYPLSGQQPPPRPIGNRTAPAYYRARHPPMQRRGAPRGPYYTSQVEGRVPPIPRDSSRYGSG
jgi:hypothetical protein